MLNIQGLISNGNLKISYMEPHLTELFYLHCKVLKEATP